MESPFQSSVQIPSRKQLILMPGHKQPYNTANKIQIQ